MVTIRKRTNIVLGSIATTKLLSLNSSELAYTIGSGNVAFEATNIGSFNIYYGNSALTLNSGGVITSNSSKMWDTISGDFTMYFRILSGGVTNQMVIQEYAGN